MPIGQTHPDTRLALARVRDVMAGQGTGQERLDRIVDIIADSMAAQVCSIYVMRAGEVLELFATKGLLQSAVHLTRLRVGEGLIGDIAAHARPLALSDAQSHPAFVFRPETGEESYCSLMGVPILRGGRVIGIAAIQNTARRVYTDEEMETLQTIAMVVAELVAGGDVVGRDELLPADGIGLLPLRLEGARVNPGLGIGRAVLHMPRFTITRLVAEDPAEEHKRLRAAVAEMHGALDSMIAETTRHSDGEHREILEAYRMIAEDAGWLARIDEAIDSGLTAEAAVRKVQTEIRVRMSQVADPYLRERVHDLEDLGNRLLQHLLGNEARADRRDLPGDVVLVARNMGPAQLLDYERSRLRGLVLEEGSATAHVAIVARALDIPVLGRVRDVLTRIEPGDPVIVDGDNAQLFIRPGEEVQQAFAEAVKARDRRRALWDSLRALPARTRDGVEIELHANAGLLVDVQQFVESGADGIGLYRTEVPFMTRPEFPDVEVQRLLYTRILNTAGGRPVVFRTLDVGGDKTLPYWEGCKEENPAMGWRAIRVSLDRPAMLRQQLRALIRAAAGRELRVMFPMVSEIAEFDAAKALLDMELRRERQRGGQVPETVTVGVMLEVPALYFQLPALLPRVGFVSVGTNDFLQFLFASDRGNPRLGDRYDVLSPVVLSVLGSIRDHCDRAGVPVSVCGEIAGRPLEAMALVGLGYRRLSVPIPSVGPVKAMIHSLETGPLRDYVATLATVSRHSVREALRAFAQDHGVNV